MDKSRIAAIRKATGLSQAEWATRLGISLSYAGHIEQGHRNVSLNLAEKIQALTGEPVVDEFLASRRGEAA